MGKGKRKKNSQVHLLHIALFTSSNKTTTTTTDARKGIEGETLQELIFRRVSINKKFTCVHIILKMMTFDMNNVAKDEWRNSKIIMICLGLSRNESVQIDEISLPRGPTSAKTTIVKRPKRCHNLYL